MMALRCCLDMEAVVEAEYGTRYDNLIANASFQ